MIEYVTGDILKVSQGVILQGLNCQGKMASGLAGQTVKKYPHVYTDYLAELGRLKSRHIDPLGYAVITTLVNAKLWHLGGFTQTYYGCDPSVKCANPRAITNVLCIAFDFCNMHNVTELSTVRIGTGLGGLELHEFDIALQTAFDIYRTTTPDKPTPLVKVFSPDF